jgi:ribosomal-protein-alanine N-acetyltransferase
MRFRKATFKDIEKIANIEHNSGYKWGQGREAELKDAKTAIKIFETYLLENKKKTIAYFALKFKKKICYIGFFAVIRSYQRKGLASKMMRKIINLARVKKCHMLRLDVWAKNFPAIGLYNKFRFYVVGIKRKYYADGDDKLVMRKNL